MKQGQLTVFIIIGILVVISFGITIYIGQTMRQPTQQAETQQRQEQLNIQPLNEYVTSCLDLASAEALDLVGKQGGVLYKSQGGITPNKKPTDDFFTYEDEEYGQLNVSYLIIPSEGDIPDFFYTEPPRYPFDGFPYGPTNQPIFTGYYGINKLPPLYKTSPETNQTVNGSIQETLEQAIAKQTTTCADFLPFKQQGYTMETKQATAELIFATRPQQFRGEQQLTITLNWPLTITSPDGTVTSHDTFTTKQPLRLATVYYTVKSLIDSDVSDISYTPQAPTGFTIETIRQADNSFLILADTESTLHDHDYEFWIPRKNRRPALWHIQTEPLRLHVAESRTTELSTSSEQLIINDPCPEPTARNTIPLQASDPDENTIRYEVDVPQSTTNAIPPAAAGVPNYYITIYAKDQSTNPQSWFDSQQLPVQVSPCIEE